MKKKTIHPFFRSKAKSECSKTIIRYWVFLFSPQRGDKEGIQKEITGMAS